MAECGHDVWVHYLLGLQRAPSTFNIFCRHARILYIGASISRRSHPGQSFSPIGCAFCLLHMHFNGVDICDVLHYNFVLSCSQSSCVETSNCILAPADVPFIMLWVSTPAQPNCACHFVAAGSLSMHFISRNVMCSLLHNLPGRQHPSKTPEVESSFPNNSAVHDYTVPYHFIVLDSAFCACEKGVVVVFVPYLDLGESPSIALGGGEALTVGFGGVAAEARLCSRSACI